MAAREAGLVTWGYLTDYSGMEQLGARFYWPELGRFIQQDPARDGMNWYAYAGNSPGVYVDPDGRVVTVIITGIAGFAGGMIGARLQCATWGEAFAAGAAGAVLGAGAGILGPGVLGYIGTTGAFGTEVLGGGIFGGVSGAAGDYIGQRIGYHWHQSPDGFRPDWASVAGAGIGGAIGGAASGLFPWAYAGTAEASTVIGKAASAIGGNTIGFGFTAFGGYMGHEAWSGR